MEIERNIQQKRGFNGPQPVDAKKGRIQSTKEQEKERSYTSKVDKIALSYQGSHPHPSSKPIGCLAPWY
jgi:hypothetical protein